MPAMLIRGMTSLVDQYRMLLSVSFSIGQQSLGSPTIVWSLLQYAVTLLQVAAPSLAAGVAGGADCGESPILAAITADVPVEGEKTLIPGHPLVRGGTPFCANRQHNKTTYQEKINCFRLPAQLLGRVIVSQGLQDRPAQQLQVLVPGNLSVS